MIARREVNVCWSPPAEPHVFTAVGDMANGAGDLWLSPTVILQCGRVAIAHEQAELARPYGWRVVEVLNCGRTLLERTARGAIMARTRWRRSQAMP